MRIPVDAASVNAEKLGAELLTALGPLYLGLTEAVEEVTVHIVDAPSAEERAQAVIAAHDKAGLTARQRAIVGLQREIGAQRKALGISKAVPGLKAFQSMEAGELARVVYLLWLVVEGWERLGAEE